MEYPKMEPYIVYVQTDSSGYITAVNSSAFLTDTDGWTEIDSGYGDKYHHAQGNYFPEFLTTDSHVWRYKLVNGEPVECSAEEIEEQEATQPEPYDENEDMLAALRVLGVYGNG